MILVSATLTGHSQSHNINLILDTGASYTMISPEILMRIGCDPTQSEDKRPITTASGIEYVSFLKIGSLKTLGVSLSSVEVCAHTLPPNLPARGLLGLSFLRRGRRQTPR
ncbi:MAG: clan AA aspartic protease [Deltaproteobacteria bacterium]|nr:clan AA aspartic protease [Deltaproteobacteria bacterium]